MTDEQAADDRPEEITPAPEPPVRRAPGKPGASRTEKAITLEVARLFGLPPKLLISETRPPDEGEDDKGEDDEQEPA